MICSNSINECWDNFMSVINSGISMFTPLKKICFSQNKKKYPLFIRQLQRKKSMAWMRYRTDKYYCGNYPLREEEIDYNRVYFFH